MGTAVIRIIEHINVARLEAIADAGGICIAGSVYDQVKSKVDVEFEE